MRLPIKTRETALKLFQSTHPSWGATKINELKLLLRAISIHAPIVGCDSIAIFKIPTTTDFNPRTHRGVRPLQKLTYTKEERFQSTHPSWGATVKIGSNVFTIGYFNPRTHRGVRPLIKQGVIYLWHNFNPRTHRGVRHVVNELVDGYVAISIHAPIVGCDLEVVGNKLRFYDFNPRTHRGVRHMCNPSLGQTLKISIHAPIVGCDSQLIHSIFLQSLFQSTHPSWGATVVKVQPKICNPNFNPRTHRGVRPQTHKEQPWTV